MADIPKPDVPDVDAGTQLLQICWVLYSIAAIVVALRTYVQLRYTHEFGRGDALMVASLTFGVSACVLLTIACHFGLGRHGGYLDYSQRVIVNRLTFIYEPFGIASSTFGRLSFMTLLYKLFGITAARRWLIMFLMAETIIINLVTAITIFTQCPNVDTLWDPVGHPGVCWSPLVQYYTGFFAGSCNAATDLILTILPAYIVWGLKMDRRTKLGLIAVMCLSVFAFVASLIKTILVKSRRDSSDLSFSAMPFFTWMNVENAVVIMATSIPMLRPMFIKKKHYAAYEMSECRSGLGTKLSSGVRMEEIEASSQENILPMNVEQGVMGMGIVKQVDHTVTYDIESAGRVGNSGGNGRSSRSISKNRNMLEADGVDLRGRQT